MGKSFAVIEIKNKELAAVAAIWDRNGEYSIKAFAMGSSDGFFRGGIADINKAADSLSGVIKKLEEQASGRIYDIFFIVSGFSVSCMESSGNILLSKYGREITMRDIDRCVSLASIVKLPKEKEILHKMVKEYSIDGETGVVNPLGMEGVRIGVVLNLILMNFSIMDNLSKCSFLAGLEGPGFIFSGVADSYRVLSDEQMDEGVLLLCVCRDSTEVTVFKDKKLVACEVLSLVINGHSVNGANIIRENSEKMRAHMISSGYADAFREITVLSEDEFDDETMIFLEALYNVPVKIATCKVRPMEQLPHERAGYIGPLGALDYLRAGKNLRAADNSLVKMVVSRVKGFLEKYF